METRIESIFTSKSKSAFLNSILEKSVPEVPHTLIRSPIKTAIRLLGQFYGAA